MTAPITHDDLDALIRTHQDTLWSHKWNMSPVAIDTVTQTIKCLEHYRDLLNTIDNREPHTDPFEAQPSLPPLENATIKEGP